jgi:hypothetical protein
LEVLLASAIGVLLMGALYVAVDVQLRHAQAGRDVIEQSNLARNLVNRIAGDIRLSVGPTIPAPSKSSGGSASSPAAGGTGTGSPGASPAISSSSPATSPSSGTGAVQFNLGVQGDANRLILSISRVPRELNFIPDADNGGQPAVSDLRRISYWLAGSSDAPRGLAWQEVKVVTSDDAMAAVPPDVPDDSFQIIAEEVKSLTFSYFDGTSWQDSWDGTAPGADGSTPLGPPLAVAITIGIATPGSGNRSPNDQPLKTYRHVVAIPTANGATQPSTSGATTP